MKFGTDSRHVSGIAEKVKKSERMNLYSALL